MGPKTDQNFKIWGIDRGPSGDVPLRPFVILSRVSDDSEACFFVDVQNFRKDFLCIQGPFFVDSGSARVKNQYIIYFHLDFI